jgi:hypothetical protein
VLAPAVAQIARIARQMRNPRRIGAKIIVVTVTAMGAFVPPAAAQGVGPVLVVGDSLEVGTEPYLRQELSGVQLDVDAKTSRPSSDGLAVLRSALGPEHEVVVFDLGTNDDPGAPDALAANLQAAADAAAGRCLVFATINRPPLGGVSDDGLNQAVDEVATATGARIADWRSVAQQPGVLQPDGVHATPSGYQQRARVVADAIRSCGGSGGGGGGGAGPVLEVEPPKPADPAPRPQAGPGLALLAAPVFAIADRAAAILGFARAAIDGLRRALDPGLAWATRVVRRIGEQP